MKRIAITSNGRVNLGTERVPGGVSVVRKTERMTLSLDYVDAVRRLGALPFVLPASSPPEALAGFDGLILSGGRDVHPSLYGHEPHEELGPSDPVADQIEAELVLAAIAAGLPTLAICRGLQLLNVALGGTLHQHLPDLGSKINHCPLNYERTLAHDVRLEPGSATEEIIGARTARTNSSHHQAIDELSSELVASGHAPDNIIEAVESSGGDNFLIGVQWHPEALPDDPVSKSLFAAFFAAC